MSESKKNIIISGGGTGGHIFPACAIANEIRRRRPDYEILFVGADNRMEMERVPAAGYKIIGLPIAGFDRKNLFKNISVLIKLAKSLLRCRKILKDFRPDIAIGVGGYASGPILRAAQSKSIPTFIQEQNSYAGVTNKLLAKKATAISVAYSNMERFFPKDKIFMTGNPIRSALLGCQLTPEQARAEFNLAPNKKTILVIGGSLGALTINRAISAAASRIAESDVQVIWQTGKYYDEIAKKQLEEQPIDNLRQMAFISNMEVAYRAADLVVSRSGAGTISELQLLGKSTLLVPSPNVSEDHQTKNAMALVECNAAVMVKDAECKDNLVNCMMELVADDNQLADLSGNIANMALRDADKMIVDKIFQIIDK
ncbi:MAG: undecaprenyldiphospho-muramoylpentapeptide beta-N-acetylglucosaminyltransferase [Bacteroidales bacterium]